MKQPRRRHGPGLRRLACVALCGALAACDEPEHEVYHPIADSLTADPAEAVHVTRDGTASLPDGVRAFVQRLEGRRVQASIGVLEGEPEYEFGMPESAAFLGDGSLAVLDRQAREVSVFDPRDGSHRYVLGGPGEGPGEFQAPMELVVREADELWVVDGPRAHRFRQGADERFEFRDRLDVDGYTEDGCATAGGSVVVHAPSLLDTEEAASTVLQTLDPDGELQTAFGAAYRHDNRLVARQMNQSLMACTDEEVLLATRNLNRLDAYDPTTGERLWHASFEGIEVPSVREQRTEDGQTAVQLDVEGQPVSHVLLNVRAAPGGPALVQFGRRYLEDMLEGEDGYVVETFVVDPAAGEGAHLGEDLPEVLAMDESRIAFYREDPVPRVEVAVLDP